jgi:hypothetical protein
MIIRLLEVVGFSIEISEQLIEGDSLSGSKIGISSC